MVSSRFCYFFLGLLFCLGTQAQHKACPDSIQEYRQVNGLYSFTPFKTMVYAYNQDSSIRSELERDRGFPYSRVNYKYESGQMIESEKRFWADGNWNLNVRKVRVKNIMGDDSAILNYMWDDKQQKEYLQSGTLFLNTYDASNRIVESIKQFYTGDSAGFLNNSKSHFYYSGTSSFPETIIDSNYYDGVWKLSSRSSQLQWANGFDPTYFYILPTVDYSEIWDGSQWEPSVYDSTVDLGNGFTRRFFYVYRSDNQRLELYRRYDTQIDSLGNEVFYEERYFTENGNLSIILSQTTSTYRFNGKGDPIQRIDSVVTYVVPMPGGGSGKHVSSMRKYAYYYSAGPSAIKTSSLKLPVYPNPAPSGGQLFLPENNWKKMELYTMDGKHLIQIKEVGNSSLRLPPLDSGVYVLILLDEAGNRYQSLLTIQ